MFGLIYLLGFIIAFVLIAIFSWQDANVTDKTKIDKVEWLDVLISAVAWPILLMFLLLNLVIDAIIHCLKDLSWRIYQAKLKADKAKEADKPVPEAESVQGSMTDSAI